MSKEEMLMARVPKVRMKSPRTRERSWAVIKAVMTGWLLARIERLEGSDGVTSCDTSWDEANGSLDDGEALVFLEPVKSQHIRMAWAKYRRHVPVRDRNQKVVERCEEQEHDNVRSREPNAFEYRNLHQRLPVSLLLEIPLPEHERRDDKESDGDERGDPWRIPANDISFRQGEE